VHGICKSNADLDNDLIYANDVFESGHRLLETFAESVHVGHNFHKLVLRIV
jgi:hypothetical protein